jgi:hypothetical protein
MNVMGRGNRCDVDVGGKTKKSCLTNQDTAIFF